MSLINIVCVCGEGGEERGEEGEGGDERGEEGEGGEERGEERGEGRRGN